jgi:hypothetical protein
MKSLGSIRHLLPRTPSSIRTYQPEPIALRTASAILAFVLPPMWQRPQTTTAIAYCLLVPRPDRATRTSSITTARMRQPVVS